MNWAGILNQDILIDLRGRKKLGLGHGGGNNECWQGLLVHINSERLESVRIRTIPNAPS